jgi:hypothetical protein
VCYTGRRGHCNSQNGSEKYIKQFKLKQIAISELIAATNSVLNPDPDRILVQQGLRIRIRNPESDPRRQNDQQKKKS